MLSWSTRRAPAARKKKKQWLEIDEIAIPEHFRCPISLDLMKDPVILSTGITYDRESIDKWIEEGNITCPVTNQVLPSFDQIPNHFIRKMIQDWCVQNRSCGVERIPTPRIPVTPYEVSETCKRITVATQCGDANKCRELVKKINNWGKESQRNKKCVVESGAGLVLSTAFEWFAKSMEKHIDLLEEILSVLNWVSVGRAEQYKLGARTSLSCILWILNNGNLSAIQNAVILLKELVSLNQRHVKALVEIEGVVQALVELIKKPICLAATKASLMVIFYMISPSEISDKTATTFVEMGLISMVIEILVDGDKSISEKALGVLDHICDSKQGRQEAYQNALIVPVLFQKISGPDLVSKFSVSILWKLCKKGEDTEIGVVMSEALQLKVDAFQKLLILLQVSCVESTKEKVKDLLKLLNFYRNKFDCIGYSMDFRYL